MVNFTYDIQYKASSFNEIKGKIERTIRSYLLDKFRLYVDLDIQIVLLPNSSFEESQSIAKVNPIEKRINLNFIRVSNYFIHLKQHNNKLLMQEHNLIFNSLHHEMQHIVNNIEYGEVFTYINSIDSCGYIKLGISDLLDEYLASYSAQKQFFYKSGTVEGLAYLCEKKDTTIATKKEGEKIRLYVDIFKALAYAIAECKVLNETNAKGDSFDLIIKNESVADFAEIFTNIRKLLECFNAQQYKEYTKKCEIELKKLLTLLNVDLQYLKKFN